MRNSCSIDPCTPVVSQINSITVGKSLSHPDLFTISFSTQHRITEYFDNSRSTRVLNDSEAYPVSVKISDLSLYAYHITAAHAVSESVLSGSSCLFRSVSISQAAPNQSQTLTPISHGLDYHAKGPLRSFSRLLLFICTFMCILDSCDPISVAQAKPLTLKPLDLAPRIKSKNPSRPNRVIMPPLGLGFRGQIERDPRYDEQAGRNNLIRNYQSDESSNGRLGSQKVQHDEGDPNVPDNWTPSDEHHKTRYEPLNLLGRSDSRSVRPRYYYADMNRGGESSWNSNRPVDVYPPYASNLPTHSSHYDNKPPWYLPPNNYAEHDYNSPPNSRTRSRNNHKTSQNPAQYETSRISGRQYNIRGSYDFHRDMSSQNHPNWYQTGNQPVYIDQPELATQSGRQALRNGASFNSQPENTLRLIGHPSNYEEVSEEDVSRKLHEYHQSVMDKESFSIPSLPKMPSSKPDRPEESGKHGNGLELYGDAAHDRLVSNFQRLASSWSLTGVETLFEEMDTNRDGVIKIDELRNFLWLHEITAPG